MTVEDLINRLKTEDPKAMVVVSGYEGGVNEVTHVSKTAIKLNVNTAWYYGKHEEVTGNEQADTVAVQVS